LKRFWLSFMISFAAIIMAIVFTTDLVPYEWQIPGWNWALIIPLSLVAGCHILLPVCDIQHATGIKRLITSLLDCSEPLAYDILILSLGRCSPFLVISIRTRRTTLGLFSYWLSSVCLYSISVWVGLCFEPVHARRS